LGLEHYRRTVSGKKRAAILRAGRENFLKYGYSRAAVAEIAHEADVSTATLYKHFSSKEALFAAVVKESYGNIGNEFVGFGEGDDIHKIFHAMARKYLEVQFDHGVNALLRVVIAEVPSTPAIALATYEFIVMRRANGLKKIFDSLIERKLLRPHDTAVGVDFISGMIKENFIWPALFNADFKLPKNTDAIIHEAIDVYLARYGV
jgi:TetR/AcrR family transcriptional regulator of autoinduction and epiphytic fitness